MRNAPVLAALLLSLALSAHALAAGQRPAATPQRDAQETQPAATAPQEQAAQPVLAALPIHMDKDLAREHELFSRFAREQVERMNANILGGRHQMQVSRHPDGRFHASFKAIDLPGVVCQVRRSESNPLYYVGNLIYSEQVLESVADSADACRRGPFTPVSEKANRLIYTSKKGGGWQ